MWLLRDDEFLEHRLVGQAPGLMLSETTARAMSKSKMPALATFVSLSWYSRMSPPMTPNAPARRAIELIVESRL